MVNHSPYATKVIAMLSPGFGEFIALAKVQAACNLAKVGIDKLDKSHLPLFADKIYLTLVDSMGDISANSIKEKILSL